MKKQCKKVLKLFNSKLLYNIDSAYNQPAHDSFSYSSSSVSGQLVLIEILWLTEDDSFHISDSSNRSFFRRDE